MERLPGRPELMGQAGRPRAVLVWTSYEPDGLGGERAAGERLATAEGLPVLHSHGRYVVALTHELLTPAPLDG
jgi:hypothetical protein